MKTLTLQALALCSLLILISGCSGNPADIPVTQIDRAGRPGFEELLIRSNEYLDTFNSNAPAVDITEVALPIRNEIGSLLTAIATYSSRHGMTAVSSATLFGGFLPNVMRIDTDVAFSGYAVDYVTSSEGYLMLTGGRKINEDIADIFLSYLFNRDLGGTSMQDNVSYAGPGAGVNPAQPGHQALLTSFPYLADPN